MNRFLGEKSKTFGFSALPYINRSSKCETARTTVHVKYYAPTPRQIQVRYKYVRVPEITRTGKKEEPRGLDKPCITLSTPCKTQTRGLAFFSRAGILRFQRWRGVIRG